MADLPNKRGEFSSPEFLEKVISRDSQAIDQIVRRYTQDLMRATLSMGFAEDIATEVVQSTWTTFFEVVPKFQKKSHIRTFIFGIMYNKASEQRREKKKSQKHDQIDEIMEKKFSPQGNWISAPMSPDRLVLAEEKMNLIESCVDALPLKLRTAFCLRELDHESTEDVCEILGVTQNNLGVILYRARNRLRNCVEHYAKKEIEAEESAGSAIPQP